MNRTGKEGIEKGTGELGKNQRNLWVRLASEKLPAAERVPEGQSKDGQTS